ncbi:hypothetical protein PtB15_6B416 [Puccinia triticina]|nr:hypothetical protein PtB15_6B416 [Puccinia triticina]
MQNVNTEDFPSIWENLDQREVLHLGPPSANIETASKATTSRTLDAEKKPSTVPQPLKTNPVNEKAQAPKQNGNKPSTKWLKGRKEKLQKILAGLKLQKKQAKDVVKDTQVKLEDARKNVRDGIHRSAATGRNDRPGNNYYYYYGGSSSNYQGSPDHQGCPEQEAIPEQQAIPSVQDEDSLGIPDVETLGIPDLSLS